MSRLENLKEITPKFEILEGILDTTFCHMGRELEPNFSKLFNSWGNPASFSRSLHCKGFKNEPCVHSVS